MVQLIVVFFSYDLCQYPPRCLERQLLNLNCLIQSSTDQRQAQFKVFVKGYWLNHKKVINTNRTQCARQPYG